MTGHTVEAGPVRGLLAAIDAALDVPAAASHTDDDLRMLVLNARIDVIRGVIRALDDVDELALRFAAGYIGGHAEPVAYVTYGFGPADPGHLPQHDHGQPGCTHKDCHDAGHDLPAPTAVADASALAAHAPVGAL